MCELELNNENNLKNLNNENNHDVTVVMFNLQKLQKKN